MDDEISLALMYLNRERILLQQKEEIRQSRRFKNRIERLFKYIKNGDFNYIRRSIVNSTITTDTSYKATGIINGSTKLNGRIAIYTVIFGEYDEIWEPLYKSSNCDYYIVTNQIVHSSSTWKKIDITEYESLTRGFSNQEMARFFKTHPHLLFKNYEYSIFVDGNVQIVADMRILCETIGNRFIGIHEQPGRDCIYQEADAIIALGKANPKEVNKQVSQYRKEGFPKHFGLFQTNVLVRKHNDASCIKLMENWWHEMEKHTKRDQLSLTYCMWCLRLNVNDVFALGPNTALNPRFFVHKHQ